MLQCVAVFCSGLQCFVCSVLQFVAVCCSVLQCVAVCCSVLQCVAVCCSVLQCVAVCCSVLQCVAVCCSMLQCVAVCCSVLSTGLIASTKYLPSNPSFKHHELHVSSKYRQLSAIETKKNSLKKLLTFSRSSRRMWCWNSGTRISEKLVIFRVNSNARQ